MAVCAVVALMLSGCTTSPWVDNVSNPGSAAKQLISPSAHPKLVVEIDHPPGYAPTEQSLAVLKSTLQEVTARPASDITFVLDPSIPAESGRKYTYREIEALEREHRDRHTAGNTAVLYVVYVAGGHASDSGNSRVLGAAYHGTSLVIFKGNIREGARGGLIDVRPPEYCIERAVLVHEFGHAAGLVNLGTPMVRPHEDPEHEGHSANKQSVMYWALENTQDLFNVLGTGCSDIPYQFDADDKADLKALRES